MSEEEDLRRSVVILDRTKETIRWMNAYILALIISIVTFSGFMIIMEITLPSSNEPTIGVLNGMITALAIVYSMTIFSILRPSVLLPSAKLEILYINTILLCLATSTLYFVSMGFVGQKLIGFYASMIYFCFLIVVGNFSFLLMLAMKFSEKAENAKIAEAWQRIGVEYEKRKKQEQESAKS
jgi:hypothetical protein